MRDRDDWTEWDYILIEALQTIDDFTDKHGLLVYETDSERVMVSAKKGTDRFQAAVDRATKGGKKGYEPAPGEVWTPVIELRGGDYPTIEEYFEKQRLMAEEERDAVQ